MILSGKYKFSRPTSLTRWQQKLCGCRDAFYSAESQAMPSSASEDQADLLKMSEKRYQNDRSEVPQWFKKFEKRRFWVDRQVKANLYNQGLAGIGKGAMPKLNL